MIILSIRTDKPEAEIGIYDDQKQLDYKSWQAHRQLSETIHTTIKKLLEKEKLEWNSIKGIVFFAGPGSFTGLRIGASVANALSYSLDANLLQTNGDRWITKGIKGLLSGKKGIALPDYGSEPKVTISKK